MSTTRCVWRLCPRAGEQRHYALWKRNDLLATYRNSTSMLINASSATLEQSGSPGFAQPASLPGRVKQTRQRTLTKPLTIPPIQLVKHARSESGPQTQNATSAAVLAVWSLHLTTAVAASYAATTAATTAATAAAAPYAATAVHAAYAGRLAGTLVVVAMAVLMLLLLLLLLQRLC
jgi:hypothetical protein